MPKDTWRRCKRSSWWTMLKAAETSKSARRDKLDLSIAVYISEQWEEDSFGGKEWGHQKDAGGGMRYWQNMRWYGHVMRREDENSMKRIMMAEVNRCCRRSYGRHHTARHEVSLIKERTYWWSKEVNRKDPSGCKGLIQAVMRLDIFLIVSLCPVYRVRLCAL